MVLATRLAVVLQACINFKAQFTLQFSQQLFSQCDCETNC